MYGFRYLVKGQRRGFSAKKDRNSAPIYSLGWCLAVYCRRRLKLVRAPGRYDAIQIGSNDCLMGPNKLALLRVLLAIPVLWVASVTSVICSISPGSAEAAGLRVASDIGGTVRVNSAARLLAGLPPTYPGHFAMAETAAWKEHSATMRASWAQVSANRVAAMSAWRSSAISSNCPGGKTLLYPFSGPDFFNAYWLFPDCENYVLFGLEHAGEVPDIESVADRDISRLLGDVRTAVSDLVDRNYFITENMSRQLRTAQLRGVTPLLIIPMALSDVEILRIVPHDLPRSVRARVAAQSAAQSAAPQPAPQPVADQPALKTIEAPQRGPMRQLSGITIEFRKPGSNVVQKLHYFTLDATDRGLAHYPEFITYLNGLAPTNTFLKAASYLLHGREFRKLRTTLLNVSDFLVQDDTGLPYYTLQPKLWDVRLYGKYETPIPPFQRAFQPTLDKAYRAALPFEFGYNFSDKRDNRSNILVGRKSPNPQFQRTDAKQAVVVKTAAKFTP